MATEPVSLEKWQTLARKELADPAHPLAQLNADGIPIQSLYTEDDLKKRGIKPSLPGFAPYTRGVRASMYTGRPWTIRQYAGFSTAQESNQFYRHNLSQGQKNCKVKKTNERCEEKCVFWRLRRRSPPVCL